MFNRIKQFFQKSLRQVLFGRVLNGGFSFFGVNNKNLVDKGYKGNPTVYSIISQITRAIIRAKPLLFKEGEERELQIGHDVTKLLLRPNPLQGYGEFQENYWGYKLLLGEVFVHKLCPDIGVNSGIPQQLWIIPPPLVDRIIFDSVGMPVSYVLMLGGGTMVIPANEMIHDKFFNPNHTDGRGMPPLEAAIMPLNQSNEGYTASARLLQNSGPMGILSTTEKNDVTFGQPQADLLTESFYEKYGGSSEYGRMVISPAIMKWTQIGLNAVDLNLIEGGRDATRNICNVFGISSILLNDTANSTFNNVREARKELIENIAIPHLETQFDKFDQQLLPAFEKRDNAEYTLDIDKTGYPELKEDLSMQSTALSNMWWTSGNEKRIIQGLGKSEAEGMDDIFVPSNLLPLSTEPEL